MRVWVVKAGEPMPGDPGTPRIMRAGHLASTLAGRGHEVVWWAAAFDHQRKRFREPAAPGCRLWRGVAIELVSSLGYTRNESLRRWLDDMVLAARAYRQMRRAPRPDVIVCSFPLIFVSLAVVVFARTRGIPVLLDIRDLWPDIFGSVGRGWRRIAYRAFAAINRPLVRFLFRRATGLIGITDPFLDWGLALAGRDRSCRDAVFPLTTFPIPADDSAIASAVERFRGLGVSSQTKNFCYVGAFGKMVDLETVVEAARILRHRRDIRIVLCGVGDEFDKVRLRGQGLDTLVFPGYVDGATIRALMGLSVAGLAPYRNRIDSSWSLSNKVIEYISCGLPVVSALSGLLGELIDREAIGARYREGDESGLAAALRDLADNPSRHQELSENATRLFERTFNPDAVYDAFACHVEASAFRQPTV